MKIDPVINAYQNLIGHRRDLDIRSIPIFVGLVVRSSLNEVYHIDSSEFDSNKDEDSDAMHTSLHIPKISHSTNHYLGSGSVDINHYLWEKHLHGSSIPSHVLHHIKSIDSDLKPMTAGKFRLYSGLRVSPAHIAATELHPSPTIVHNSGYHSPIYVWKADSFGAQKQKKKLY